MAGRDAEAVRGRIRQAVGAGALRITQHAHEQMVDEDIMLTEVIEAVSTAVVLEDYPEHRRGPCCLLSGETRHGRPIHVVCTTDSPLVIVITTYEPKPPKWTTPSRRGGRG